MTDVTAFRQERMLDGPDNTLVANLRIVDATGPFAATTVNREIHEVSEPEDLGHKSSRPASRTADGRLRFRRASRDSRQGDAGKSTL